MSQTKIKVLLADDNKEFCDVVVSYLNKQEDITVVAVAYDGVDACNKIQECRPDIAVIDGIMPRLDGLGVLERLQKNKDGFHPVCIMLSAITQEKVIQKAMDLGAAYYIVKPFEIIELLARINVVLRRYQKCDMVLNIGGLKIDTCSRQVWRDKQEINLTKTEYEMLLLFARNPRRAMYRETIYERVWGDEYPFGSKVVDLHVQRMRKKVGWENILKAVNKVGYRLEV